VAKFSLAVKGHPDSPAIRHSLEFAKSVVARGHEITGIFFYGDAVFMCLKTRIPSSATQCLGSQWQKFLLEHGLEAIVCVAAALRRGVLDYTEAKRHHFDFDLLRDGFVISGLGQLIAANTDADHALSFG
jgi:tRNA 2-thiouridine synthesizing protein D